MELNDLAYRIRGLFLWYLTNLAPDYLKAFMKQR